MTLIRSSDQCMFNSYVGTVIQQLTVTLCNKKNGTKLYLLFHHSQYPTEMVMSRNLLIIIYAYFPMYVIMNFL